MTRSTQKILYHLLPVTAWLLAIGGIVVWAILSTFNFQFSTYVPALLAWIAVLIIHIIPRHGDSVEPCFKVGLLLGIAAYWLPSVIILILPIWGVLIYRNLFGMRALLATLLGLTVVAIWLAVLNFFPLSTFNFQLAHNVRAWIPTGAILLAWLISTIVRQTLRER